MKTFFCLLLAMLLFIFCSCNANTNHNKELMFYYPRAEYIFNDPDGVIGKDKKSEMVRNLSLDEFIALYLRGTDKPELASPLSDTVELLETRIDKNRLHIIFTSDLADLPAHMLTISLSALSKTVFQVTDVDTICIHADNVLLNGEQKVEFTRQSVYFWDSYTDVIPTQNTLETDDESK